MVGIKEMLQSKISLAREKWPNLHYMNDIVAEGMTCSACQDVMKEPVVLDSGHQYCRGCTEVVKTKEQGYNLCEVETIKCLKSGKLCENILPTSDRNKINEAKIQNEFIATCKGERALECCQECDYRDANIFCEGCDKWLCGGCTVQIHPYPHDENSLGADEHHIKAAGAAQRIQDELKDTWASQIDAERSKLKSAIAEIDAQVASLHSDFGVEETLINTEADSIVSAINKQHNEQLSTIDRFVEKEVSKMDVDRNRLLSCLSVYNKGLEEIKPALAALSENTEAVLRARGDSDTQKELLLLRQLQFVPKSDASPDWLCPEWESIDIDITINDEFDKMIKSGAFSNNSSPAETEKDRREIALRTAQESQRPEKMTDDAETWPIANHGALRIANNKEIKSRTKKAKETMEKEKAEKGEEYAGLQNPVAVSINTDSPTAVLFVDVEENATFTDVRNAIEKSEERSKLPKEFKLYNSTEWVSAVGKAKVDIETGISISSHGPGGEASDVYEPNQGLYTLYCSIDDESIKYTSLKAAQESHRGPLPEDTDVWDHDKQRLENNEKIKATELPESDNKICVGISLEGTSTSLFTVIVDRSVSVADVRNIPSDDHQNTNGTLPEYYSFFKSTDSENIRVYASGCGPAENEAESAVKIEDFIVEGICVVYVKEDSEKQQFAELKSEQNTKLNSSITAAGGDIDIEPHSDFTSSQKDDRENDVFRLESNKSITQLTTEENLGVGICYAGNIKCETVAVAKESKLSDLREAVKEKSVPKFYKFINSSGDSAVDPAEEENIEISAFTSSDITIVYLVFDVEAKAVDDARVLKEAQDAARGEKVESKFAKEISDDDIDAERLSGNEKITSAAEEGKLVVGIAYAGSPVIIDIVKIEPSETLTAVRTAIIAEEKNNDEQIPKSFKFTAADDTAPVSVQGITISYILEDVEVADKPAEAEGEPEPPADGEKPAEEEGEKPAEEEGEKPGEEEGDKPAEEEGDKPAEEEGEKPAEEEAEKPADGEAPAEEAEKPAEE